METTAPGSGGGGSAPAERPQRPRTKPTPQGGVYLWTIAVFSLAMVWFEANLVFLMGALVLGCAAVAWFLARRNLSGVTARRSLPRTTRVGVPTALTWTLHNGRRSGGLGLEIDDRPARGLRPVRLQVEFPYVAAGASQEVGTQVVFGRRGRVDLGSAETWLWSRYPLGLFRSAVALRSEGQILVRPAEGRISQRLREVLRGRLESDPRRRRTWRGEDLIYGVREYREGDDPRRVHWRSTARRGTLVVSQWRADQGRETIIVLGRGRAAGTRGNPAFERAVSCAATLWRHCARRGLRARLVLGSGSDLTMGEGGRGLEAGLDQLALVGPQGSRHPRRTLRALRDPTAARSVVYVGSGKEPGVEQDLAAAAGRGGSHVLLRTDLRSIRTWVRGLA